MRRMLTVFVLFILASAAPLVTAAFPGDYTPMEMAREMRRCQYQKPPCVGIFDTSRPRYMDLEDCLIIGIFLLVSITYLLYKQRRQSIRLLIMFIRFFVFWVWLIIPLIIFGGLFQLLEPYLDNLSTAIIAPIIVLIMVLPIVFWNYLGERSGLEDWIFGYRKINKRINHNQGGT